MAKEVIRLRHRGRNNWVSLLTWTESIRIPPENSLRIPPDLKRMTARAGANKRMFILTPSARLRKREIYRKNE